MADGAHRQGLRVLVTGAGTGIGQAIAERLADAGCNVVGTVRNAERAARRTQAAAPVGRSLRYVALELTDAGQIADVAARILADGGVDALIHNAGFGVFGAIEDVDGAVTERQFAVNVFGPLALTRALLPSLRARRGRIVWIGSLAGRMTLPFQGHYSATKAAIASLSDALRMELAPHGVRVTCVEPSDFATGFTDARCMARSQDSPYAAAFDRCLREVERQERGAPSPERVASVVQALLETPAPPARRPVGGNARLICLLHRLMPARWTERLVRGHYGV
jgi:NAD(P)-dependent dehydrogenase (short-subunit alcohol dehydrogenase family)